MRYATDMVVLC